MKKFLFSTIIFTIILFSFSCFCFADNLTNDVKHTTENVGNAIANTSNGAKNMIQNAENGIENGANNVKNMIMNGSENVTNDAKNVTNDVAGAVDNMDNTNYTAERTASNNGFMGMSPTSWTWLILGIVGVVIVGLVWYYGSQYEHTNYSDGE